MAVGLLLPFGLFIIWPAVMLRDTIKKLPFGGERELALIHLVLLLAVAFLVVNPQPYTALDTTPIETITDLSTLRGNANSGNPFTMFRAAPFVLGAKSIDQEVWISFLTLGVLLTVIFSAATRMGGPTAGVAAILFLLADTSFRNMARTFSLDPLFGLGWIIVVASLVDEFAGPNRRKWHLLAHFAALVALVYWTSALPIVHQASFVGAEVWLASTCLAVFGSLALRWWSRGLRVEVIAWKGFFAWGCVFVIGLLLLAGQYIGARGVTSTAILFCTLVVAILAASVVGGFWRMLRIHQALVAVVPLIILIGRITAFPYEPHRVGGFRSTVDDLLAILPADAEVVSSLSPALLQEFLHRPVTPIRAFLERAAPNTTGLTPVIIETRFASEVDKTALNSKFILTPLLPGILKVAASSMSTEAVTSLEASE